MASQLQRQAATYKRQAAKGAATPAPARNPPPSRPLSQLQRQALAYKNQSATSKVDTGAFQKFKQETGLSEEQARRAVDWLLADEKR